MPPKAQPSPFVKRPAPAGFVKRVAGPPKSSKITRPTQLSLDIADETSILLGIFFATHQNIQPDYAVMEKICLALNTEGFHYGLTASGFEHAFRDWRIYADKVLERIGGAHVAIKAGARPKSDRQVARLKKDGKLDKYWKYEPKTNVPKDKDTCVNDELENVDPQPVPKSSLHLTCNAPQSHDDGAELTTSEPVQELTEHIPEEAAEDPVAKPATKKTTKRKRTKAAKKDQPEDDVLPQDSAVVTHPAGSKDLANLRQSDETSTSGSETHPSQALDRDTTADNINVANAPFPLPKEFKASSQPTDNLPAQASRDIESFIRAHYIGATTEVEEPQQAVHKQNEVIVEPESHVVAEKEALAKKEPALRKKVATRASKAIQVFQPPTGTFSERVTQALEKSNDGVFNYLKKHVHVESTGCDGQGEKTYMPKEVVEETDKSKIMAWNGTFQTVKKLIRDNELDADLELPNEIDIYRNTFQDLGHEVTIRDETSPIPAFGRAPHLIMGAISRFHPYHDVQDASRIEFEADMGLEQLRSEVELLEASQENNRLLSLKRRRNDVYDIDGKISESTAAVQRCQEVRDNERKAKGDILDVCEKIAAKFAPGGEHFESGSKPNPNRDRVFIRAPQPSNMIMPWEEKKKRAKGKGKKTEGDESAESEDDESDNDDGAEAPIAKRQRRAGNAGQKEIKPRQQRKPRGTKAARTSLAKEASFSENPVSEAVALREQPVRKAKFAKKPDPELNSDIDETANAAALEDSDWVGGNNVVNLEDED
ncbi:MAG: hypothetical protein Q9188_001501 [Gyalolechia gomerana]